MVARHFEHIEQHVRDCAQVFAGAGDDLLADLRQLRGSFERSTNPLTRRAALAGHGDPHSRLYLLTRVRLLRLAVRHRLGDPLHSLPDPRGGVLTARVQGGRFRAASAHAGTPALAMAAAN
jgi:hypothetical protein